MERFNRYFDVIFIIVIMTYFFAIPFICFICEGVQIEDFIYGKYVMVGNVLAGIIGVIYGLQKKKSEVIIFVFFIIAAFLTVYEIVSKELKKNNKNN